MHSDGKQSSTPAWLMEYTSNAAETFVTAYYAAADSPQRSQLLPSLYLSSSSIAWNGNPISGAIQFAQLLDAQPGTQHEIQSFDCHALGLAGDQDNLEAPSLLLVVSGTVAYYTPESLAKTENSAPKSASAPVGAAMSKRKFDADAPLSTHPRVFSQSFVLVSGARSGAEGGVPFVWTPNRPTSKNKNSSTDTKASKTVARYFVQADALRFVG